MFSGLSHSSRPASPYVAMSSIRRRKQGEFVRVCVCVCFCGNGASLNRLSPVIYHLALAWSCETLSARTFCWHNSIPLPPLNRQLAYNKDNDISPAILHASYLIPIYIHTYLSQCRVIPSNFDDKIITCHNSCALSQLSIDIILFVYDKSGI